jgi:hypothetical protein
MAIDSLRPQHLLFCRKFARKMNRAATVELAPEYRRARAKRYVLWCNNAVHEAPWTVGDRRTTGGINVALELAELAYGAHGLHYEGSFSKMNEFPPGRFRWIYSEGGEFDDCVLVLDLQSQRLAVWPHWFG